MSEQLRWKQEDSAEVAGGTADTRNRFIVDQICQYLLLSPRAARERARHKIIFIPISMINGKWMVTNKLHRTQEKRTSSDSSTNAEQIFCFRHFKEKQMQMERRKSCVFGRKNEKLRSINYFPKYTRIARKKVSNWKIKITFPIHISFKVAGIVL